MLCMHLIYYIKNIVIVIYISPCDISPSLYIYIYMIYIYDIYIYIYMIHVFFTCIIYIIITRIAAQNFHTQKLGSFSWTYSRFVRAKFNHA